METKVWHPFLAFIRTLQENHLLPKYPKNHSAQQWRNKNIQDGCQSVYRLFWSIIQSKVPLCHQSLLKDSIQHIIILLRSKRWNRLDNERGCITNQESRSMWIMLGIQCHCFYWIKCFAEQQIHIFILATTCWLLWSVWKCWMQRWMGRKSA